MRILALLCVLLAACGPTRIVTRTETIEIPRLEYVPIPTRLVEPTLVEPTPPDCVWQTLPTLCVGQLAERCALLGDALESCNADKASIQSLQPE